MRMGLFEELVAGLKAILIDELRTYVILFVGVVVFLGTMIAGQALFGEVVAAAIGFVCALLSAAVVGNRFPTDVPADQQ